MAHSRTQFAQPVAAQPRIDLGVLDGLRGLAALYVVLYHSTRLLWGQVVGVPRGSSALDVGLTNGWLASMQYGQDAVLLFFVLSGFCIHYRQAKQAVRDPRGSHNFKVRDFAWRRVRRLFPVLVVAIALTVILDSVGTSINPDLYNGSPSLYNRGLGFPWNMDLVDRSYSLSTLIGNLLFQATVVVPAFGSNKGLWSLAYEFWFYAAYPLFLLLSRYLGSWRTMAATTIIAVLGLALTRVADLPLPYSAVAVISHWPTWVAGAVVAEFYVRARHRIPAFVYGLIGGPLLAGLLLTRPGGGPATASWQDLLWGLAFACLLAWAMLSSPRSIVARALVFTAPMLRPLGAISYSLYVLHLPWLFFLCAAWLAFVGLIPLGPELMAIGVVSSLALAGACWYAVERHFVTARTQRAATAPSAAPEVAVPAVMPLANVS